jgi:hypothetical protein
MEIDEKNLENALGSKGVPEKPVAPEMPKEMEIGFHQGALNTLASERIELIKMIQNVEKIMSMHIQKLESLGVKVQRSEEDKKE